MPRTPLQALAFLLGFWLALWISPLRAAAADGAAAALEAALHDGIQAVRERHHRVFLARRAELDRVARAHSLDMVRRGYLAHEAPDGTIPPTRLAGAGVQGFTLAAENIGQSDERDPVRALVEGWLASPRHRENLLAPAMNATGIGAARARDGSWIVTQLYLAYPR